MERYSLCEDDMLIFEFWDMNKFATVVKDVYCGAFTVAYQNIIANGPFHDYMITKNDETQGFVNIATAKTIDV